jgi:hypothetical protein
VLEQLTGLKDLDLYVDCPRPAQWAMLLALAKLKELTQLSFRNRHIRHQMSIGISVSFLCPLTMHCSFCDAVQAEMELYTVAACSAVWKVDPTVAQRQSVCELCLPTHVRTTSCHVMGWPCSRHTDQPNCCSKAAPATSCDTCTTTPGWWLVGPAAVAADICCVQLTPESDEPPVWCQLLQMVITYGTREEVQAAQQAAAEVDNV